MAKRISPALFGLALICFVLPWINVSCAGKEVASFSGIQLVTGTTIKKPPMTEARRVKGNIFLTLTLATVIIGGGISLLPKKEKVSAIAGIAALVFLLLFRIKAHFPIAKMIEETEGILTADYGSGFYLTLLFLISAVGWNYYSVSKAGGITSLPLRSTSATAKFCTACGTKSSSSSPFCNECGAKIK